ncbi:MULTISPECIES: hypothetical protein [unclassified Sphingobacterium]|uniref:hypothetical protein n=1 Tax=unclassified Sphingobacterium TaxID=2609468 RepID=UPI0025F503B0|nr:MULTISPECIES: hypothetical protein [unclassified Sphingobacterium]
MDEEFIYKLRELLKKQLGTSNLLAEYELIIRKHPDYLADQCFKDIHDMKNNKRLTLLYLNDHILSSIYALEQETFGNTN